MTRLVIRGGTVVTGDGRTVLEDAAVVVEGGLVVELVHGRPLPVAAGPGERIVDATGRLVMPGAVNNHAHGIVRGPFQPNAQAPLPLELVLANLDRHLLEGTTSLLSVDGFATPAERTATAARHPLHLFAATSDTPGSRRAALLVDGAGLTAAHLEYSAERALADGAIALGEIGSGFTLAGGGQDHTCIPDAVRRATGREVSPLQANALKTAVLGRYGDPAAYERVALLDALEAADLGRLLTAERARELIETSVLPSMEVARQGMLEAGALARAHGVAVIGHNSAPTRDVLLELARLGTRLVAGHSNHPTFTVEEAVEQARALQRLGATVDLSTLDTFGARRLGATTEMLAALFETGCVETLSTDYAGGYHDGLLVCLEWALVRGLVDLPRAVRLVTSAPVEAVPGLAPGRGRLEAGRPADLVVTGLPAVSRVETVLVDGRIVVEAGRRVEPAGG